MTEGTTPEPQLNRAGRRAESRRLRKAGALMAAIPAAFGTTALLVGATASTAGAADLVVTNLDPSGAGSLQNVAEAANDDDVITFQAGLTGTIFLDDQIDIDTSITIRGPGPDVITVSGDTGNDGSPNERIFELTGPTPDFIDVEISGLTLTDGNSTRGSAVSFDYANVLLDNVVITGNSATSSGGGIASDSGYGATLTIRNSTISGNTSGYRGGGVYMYVAEATTVIENTQISGNYADDDGGGLFVGAEHGTEPAERLTITDSTISNNTGAEGGGVFVYYINGVDITGTTISGNVATDDGGGGLFFRYVLDHVNISGSTITANSSVSYGGGIYTDDVDGPITIEFTTISDNTADESGGGIEFYNSPGSLTIRNSSVTGNSTAVDGGGIYISDSSGAVVIDNSTITGNTADGEGGAISFEGYYGLTINQSTIAANVGTTVGGIWITDPSIQSVETKDATKDAERAEDFAAKTAEKAEAGKDAPTPRAPRERVGTKATVLPVVLSGTIVSQNSGADSSAASRSRGRR